MGGGGAHKLQPTRDSEIPKDKEKDPKVINVLLKCET